MDYFFKQQNTSLQIAFFKASISAPTACASLPTLHSISLTTRLPTITASATYAIFAALSALLIPNPTPIGKSK